MSSMAILPLNFEAGFMRSMRYFDGDSPRFGYWPRNRFRPLVNVKSTVCYQFFYIFYDGSNQEHKFMQREFYKQMHRPRIEGINSVHICTKVLPFTPEMPVFSCPLQSSSAVNSAANGPTADPFFRSPQSHSKDPRDVSPQHPSNGWLQSPAWIGVDFVIYWSSTEISLVISDGGIDPPHFYYSHAKIEAARRKYGKSGADRNDTPCRQVLAIDPVLLRSDALAPTPTP
jgi:hypothetical protein